MYQEVIIQKQSEDPEIKTNAIMAEHEILKAMTIIEDELKEKVSSKYFIAYKNNPIQFINNEVFIFNPDKDPATIPFKLYPYQEKFLDEVYIAYKTSDKILDEKTRQDKWE